MGMKKKTIKLVNKLLHDPAKRKMYTDEELIYMARQVVYMEKERKARKLQRKKEKGFGYE
jgi:hypothetical protein